MALDEVSYLFLVGAPKSGTTSLAWMLDRDPEVCVASVKESRYFTHVRDRTWTGPGSRSYVGAVPESREGWLGLFAAKPEARWRVDATTDYLSMPESAELIRAFAEEVGTERVLVAAILRDPVARAISEYQHTRRDAHQTESLRDSLALEAERTAQGYIPLFHHVRRSQYSEDIARYRALFGARFLLLDYHRLEASYARLSAAMGIAEEVGHEPMVRANASFVPRSLFLRRIVRSPKANRVARRVFGEHGGAGLIGAIERYNNSGKLKVPARDIRTLRAALAKDIARCQNDPEIPTEHWRMALGGPEKV